MRCRTSSGWRSIGADIRTVALSMPFQSSSALANRCTNVMAVTAGPGWKLQTLSLIFMGWGFYMIHGCLQVFASELSVEARATALSLHSFFFFMGQTIGPIAYGFGIQHAGKTPTLLAAATVVIALGFVCARLLRQTRPVDAAARPDVEP